MHLRNASFERSWRVPAVYRLLRGIVRFGAWLFFPKLRLLNREELAQSQSALLVVNYPESFLAALLLVAAIDRPVLCLLSSQNLRGPFRKLVGRGLGIMAIEPAAEDQGPGFNRFSSALAHWGAIALFAGQSGKSQRAPGVDLAAKLASEAAKQQIQLAIYPLHIFLPLDDRKAGLLLYVEGSIQDQSSPAQPPELYAELSGQLAEAVQKALQENVFALGPVEVERFQSDLENLAHEELEEEWSELSNWKQQAGDFRLSGLVKQWIDEQNQTNPGRLVALRRLVEDYREARRRCSLGRLRVGTSSLWQKSGLRVASTWVESLLGLPIALYGFINHVAAGAILFLAGLLKKSRKRDPKVEWLLRAFIVLGCYTIQVLLFDLWQGRAAAGYYTLTLPLSGVYLWRYFWLARSRSHLLLLKATLPARSARLRRTRKALLGKFEGEMNLYAQSLGMHS